MHRLLEDFAQENGLRDVNPSLKILLGLGSILLCVSSPGPATPLLIAASLSAVTIGLARIPLRCYARLLMVPASFAVMSIAVILFLTGGGAVLVEIPLPGFALTVTTGGANLSLLLAARVLGGMCSLFFISLTTPMTDIFTVMQRLRFPTVFIDLAMLTYRFIFVLIDEAGQIYRSQRMRLGYGTFAESIRSFGMLAGALFLRTWESGEDLMRAMDARCYDGRFGLPDEAPPVSPASALGVVLYLACVAGVSWTTATITLC
ncbi:cobalt ABC transporter permease [Methanoculleus taiwanensis]|uniref:Cobalt ABC transporter permease n=1 Tax=Methanoculleus taiwanensis TaxID=1550565 RepID=A0A498H2L7_9EURY|nr:cobalt ECF transporter T component CbiQ [Methanoculleus taiwanensis]RXE57182.1 cobalt ABC transporter permease [Methanoculleus taiwanensis]